MKPLTCKLLPLALATLVSTLHAGAHAQAAATPEAEALPITGNFTITNNYVSRGFTQSWSKPAIQGGIDYAHASGFFVGT